MRESRDYGWDSLRLTAGEAELVLVPAIGGRLMGIRLDGHELLYIDPDLAGRTLSVQDLNAAGPYGFPLWGGEKTWIAPQSAWPNAVPMPDLDSLPYEVATDGGAVILTSGICRLTGLQIERRFATDGTGWTTRHTIRNRGDETRVAGAWSVMMVRRDTTYLIPSPASAVVPMLDNPVHLIDDLGSLTRVRCTDATRFKTGHPLTEGWFACFSPLPARGAAMIAQFLSTSPDPGRWAHGHAAEVYNSDGYSYSEMETHGPAMDLSPDEDVTWEVRTVVREVAGVPETAEEARALLGA